MKIYICIYPPYSEFFIGAKCYFVKEKLVDNMHKMITILFNNKKYYLFDSEFKNTFISICEYRKIKLEKLKNIQDETMHL